MSYFDGADSDEDKKYGGSDDESDNSSTNSDILGGEVEAEGAEEEDIEENEILSDEESESDDEDEYEMEGGDPDEAEAEAGAGEQEEGSEIKKAKRVKKIPAKQPVKPKFLSDNDDDDDDEYGEAYLQKFDKEINDNYIVNAHPECVSQNYDEISAMAKVVRDENGTIIDDLHRTIPYLTKFEKARILGQRAKQINSGATPFVKVPESVIDGYVIAEMELKEKRIPFIIRRPLPNGGSEYWSIKDLEDISF